MTLNICKYACIYVVEVFKLGEFEVLNIRKGKKTPELSRNVQNIWIALRFCILWEGKKRTLFFITFIFDAESACCPCESCVAGVGETFKKIVSIRVFTSLVKWPSLQFKKHSLYGRREVKSLWRQHMNCSGTEKKQSSLLGGIFDPICKRYSKKNARAKWKDL